MLKNPDRRREKRSNELLRQTMAQRISIEVVKIYICAGWYWIRSKRGAYGTGILDIWNAGYRRARFRKGIPTASVGWALVSLLNLDRIRRHEPVSRQSGCYAGGDSHCLIQLPSANLKRQHSLFRRCYHHQPPSLLLIGAY